MTSPRTPLVVRAGGVEVVTLSAQVDPVEAERFHHPTLGGTYLGIRVATLNASGSLYDIEHTVARLNLDSAGSISDAVASVHRSLPAFSDLKVPPPGDPPAKTRQTPAVWADQHWVE